jgi:REP element-mobilizing transposase RayT
MIDLPGKLWQRNYYERVIRNVDEYNRIAEYIKNNPQNWRNDKLWSE